MCDVVKKQYLFRLKGALDLIDRDKYPIQYFMFHIMCKRYQDYVLGNTNSPKITKTEFLELACENGILHRRPNGELPDNRSLRKAFQSLVYSGYPVGATSSSSVSGYGIIDNIDDIAHCINEDEKRAKMLLAKTKARRVAIGFIQGQMTTLDIIDNEDIDE